MTSKEFKRVALQQAEAALDAVRRDGRFEGLGYAAVLMKTAGEGGGTVDLEGFDPDQVKALMREFQAAAKALREKAPDAETGVVVAWARRLVGKIVSKTELGVWADVADCEQFKGLKRALEAQWKATYSQHKDDDDGDGDGGES